MRVVAFTGSRQIPPESLDAFESIIDSTPADLYVTGACIGVDQAISHMIATTRPLVRQRIIVPRDRTRVDRYWLSAMHTYRHVEIIEMGRGTTYRDRNLAILGAQILGWPGGVDPIHPDLLIGFPLFPEDDEHSLRSGSWQTIRLARSRNIPVEVHSLSALALAGRTVHH